MHLAGSRNSPLSGNSPAGQRTFLHWTGERGAGVWNTEKDWICVLLPVGAYHAQARIGDLVSPDVDFDVVPGTERVSVELAPQPCPDFSIAFVDAAGAPLDVRQIRLRDPLGKAAADPWGVRMDCSGGTVKLHQILPGTYDVEFLGASEASFHRVLDLRPDAASVRVERP